MRTTVDLPEDLLEKARKGAGLRTTKETLITALKALVRTQAYQALRQIPGKIVLDVDTNISRGRNKPARQI